MNKFGLPIRIAFVSFGVALIIWLWILSVIVAAFNGRPREITPSMGRP